MKAFYVSHVESFKSSTFPFFPGCHAVCCRVQGCWIGRNSAPVVPWGGQEGVLCRLPIRLLRPPAPRRSAGAGLEAQHHGFCHAVLHPSHERVPHKGWKYRAARKLVFTFFANGRIDSNLKYFRGNSFLGIFIVYLKLQVMGGLVMVVLKSLEALRNGSLWCSETRR